MTAIEQKVAAKAFAQRWAGRGQERSDCHSFWTSLLRDVFGVEDLDDFIKFEKTVRLGHASFIDGYIPKTKVLIEQKGIDKDLERAEVQSDGAILTPFQQAKRYAAELPYSERPRWIVTSNFKSFHIHDMDRPDPEVDPQIVELEDLEREYWRLSFLVDLNGVHIQKEEALSLQAGLIVGKIYDKIRSRYVDPDSEVTQKSLNVLCVRLVFCLFAEDAGLFGAHSSFGDFIDGLPVDAVRSGLIDLFNTLDTPESRRSPYLGEALRKFPYVNGGLFHGQDYEIPSIDQEIKDLIVHEASEGFDWSQISPTIFGAVFESTLATRQRNTGAMHYTSVENIRKVIGPLFLWALNDRLESILVLGEERTKKRRLRDFLSDLGRMQFFDPACGSGNFLTETYLSLRRLENKALKALLKYERLLDLGNVINVKLENFCGVEIDGFACSVAKASLWIAECQMIIETQGIVCRNLDCFPLKTAAKIVCADALELDWKRLLVPDDNTFLVGNPPFIGCRRMTDRQATEIKHIFDGVHQSGKLDYVAAWFKLATSFLQGSNGHAAFVSTNSIVQGEQPGILFDHLFNNGLVIDYAWRPFKWESESMGNPAVTCVIVGFHCGRAGKRVIYDEAGQPHNARNINAYLVDGPNIAIKNSTHVLCDVPEGGIGNKPIDGGNYLFTAEQKAEFLRKEPRAKKFFREWVGADELIYGYRRHCLYLAEATPQEIRSMPSVRKRVEDVRTYRLNSSSVPTQRLARTPLKFHVTNIPNCRCLVIPEVSSESRDYIPMAFLDGKTLCSNLVKMFPGAQEYHFGVLTSSVHMAWTRAVCGRREMRYRYSTGIVYNNFPWPRPSEEQKTKIEEAAKKILVVREKYRTSSFDALYAPGLMPEDLLKAHEENDRVVKDAYGFASTATEFEIVGKLMTMYQDLVSRG